MQFKTTSRKTTSKTAKREKYFSVVHSVGDSDSNFSAPRIEVHHCDFETLKTAFNPDVDTVKVKPISGLKNYDAKVFLLRKKGICRVKKILKGNEYGNVL